MKKYTEMTKDELMQEKTALEAEYEKIKNLGLSLTCRVEAGSRPA